MAGVTPELFADGKCGKPLPAGELLQVFKFGQFCSVKVLDGSVEAIVTVGKGRQSSGTSTRPITGSSSAATTAAGMSPVIYFQSSNGGGHVAERYGEFTFKQLLTGETSLKTPPASTRLTLTQEQVARIIATGHLEHPEGSWTFALTPAAIAGLLNGQSVELEARSKGGHGLLMIQPEDAVVRRTASMPSVTEFVVPEHKLADFLSDPWLPGEDALRFDLTLKEKNIEELIRNMGTVVNVGGRQIKVNVTKQPLDPNVIPSLGIETGPPTGRHLPGMVDTRGTPIPPAYQPRRPLKAQDFKGITLALYFEWTQEWILKGFSRGRLLHSLALAPQEETTIELFTWDRRKRTLEQSSLTETEESVDDEQKTQDSMEILRELTKKHDFELKVGGELDAQYNTTTVNVKLKAEANAQDKTNAEDVTKNTTKMLREGLRKAASKVKMQRSSKISETTEIGREERITRKVRNPNLCHTLNLDYFEVITHYEIITSFNEDGMRFCAVIPNPVAEENFKDEFVRQHEEALRDAILDRALVSGFDALRLIRARTIAEEELDRKRQRRKPEPIPLAPGPEKKPDTPVALSAEESAANNYLVNLQHSSKKVLMEALVGDLRNALRSLDSDQPAMGTKKGMPRSGDLDSGKRWLAQQLFLRYFSQLSQILGDLAAALSPLSVRDWGPKLAPVMPPASAMPRPSQLGLEPREVKEGLMVEIVRPNVAWDLFAANWAWWWGEILRVGLMEPDDAGLGATVEQFDKVYRAFLDSESRKSEATPGRAVVQQAQAAQDQLSDEDRLEADFPVRDYAMATERAEVLLKHLMEHKHHYSFALFRALPPQEQLEHIERAMASVETGFDPGFFQPRVVSQIGSSLLVPLNHEVIPKATELLDILKGHINVQPATDTVLLPSPGMTTEARLGQCSACEDFIEETRKIELEMRRSQLRQAKAEANRLEKRLEVTPPQLNDPKPALEPIRVRIEQPPSP